MASFSQNSAQAPLLGHYDTPGFNGGRYEGIQQDSLVMGTVAIDSQEEAEGLIAEAMEEARQQTQGANAGSTASVAIIKGPQLVVGQLGDSPVMLFVQEARTGIVRAFDLTHDHAPSAPSEEARIQREGGIIMNGRVNGNLAVARAFGDRLVGAGVGKQPDIYSCDVRHLMTGPKDRVWAVVASDGLTERAMADLYAPLFAQSGLSPNEIARAMAEKAMQAGSTDNISVAVTQISLNSPVAAFSAVMDGHGKGGEHVSSFVRNIFARKMARSGEKVAMRRLIEDFVAGKSGALSYARTEHGDIPHFSGQSEPLMKLQNSLWNYGVRTIMDHGDGHRTQSLHVEPSCLPLFDALLDSLIAPKRQRGAVAAEKLVEAFAAGDRGSLTYIGPTKNQTPCFHGDLDKLMQLKEALERQGLHLLWRGDQKNGKPTFALQLHPASLGAFDKMMEAYMAKPRERRRTASQQRRDNHHRPSPPRP